MQQISSTLQILLARFGGVVLVPFAAGAETIGISQQTARNQLCAGKFPLETVMVGSRRFIHVAELARYVDSLVVVGETAKSKRGRPPKGSKFHAAQDGRRA
jgi:hypothetical protein